MNPPRRTPLRTVTAMLLGVALLTAGCAANGSGQAESANTVHGYFGTSAEGSAPVDGGVLVYASFQSPTSLDPTVALGTGTTGGNELTAIFDTLLSYNVDTNEYEGNIASSFAFNDAGTQLTLSLRPDVTFTDGTPLDAQAVVANLTRHVERKSRFASALSAVTDYQTPDPLTAVLTSDAPMYQLLSLFTNLPGMIVSTTAVATLGDEEFGRNPVGAGPFRLDKWEPEYALSLAANKGYWGGAPHLDGLRFTYPASADVALDTLRSGQVHGMFTREPEFAAILTHGDFAGYSDSAFFSQTIAMNNREGQPTADIRVRRAVVAALDPDSINERAFNGDALPTTSIAPEGSPLHAVSSTLGYDPELARRLVAEVKAEGWDGSMELICGATPQEMNLCMGVEASLNDVGMSITSDFPLDKTQRVFVKHEYQLGSQTMAISDTDVYTNLANNFAGGAKATYTAYSDPASDAGIQALGAAKDLDARKKAIADIQAAWDANPPVAIVAGIAGVNAWSAQVSGIVAGASGTVRFDRAFLIP